MELARDGEIAPSVEEFQRTYPDCCTVERNVSLYDEWTPERDYLVEAERLHVRPAAVVRISYRAADLDGTVYPRAHYYWLGSCGEFLDIG